MHTNVIAFPKTRPTSRAPLAGKARHHAIQCSEWRQRTKDRWTPTGVYFVSQVLCFGGGAA